MSFVAVIGASGCGKTTIINTMIQRFPHLYLRAKSYTTRPKRDNEFSEYEFVSDEQLQELLSEGKILYIDEAYGYKYAMDATVFLPQDKDIVKEIHPSNVKKIEKHCDDLIIVKVVSSTFCENRGRIEDYDSSCVRADITISNNVEGSLEALINTLSRQIQAIKFQRNLGLPLSDEIDRSNLAGYNKIASEFYDIKRITTANFHDASASFFKKELDRCKREDVILEVGSGNGWLNSLSNKNLPSIDIADEMDAGVGQEHVGVRQFKCGDDTFDAIFASLCDPYFYPEAIIALLRILKRGGRLVISLPSHEWCRLNRDGAKKTKFVGDDGSACEVYSFTYSQEQIVFMGKKLGFIIDKYEKCKLGADYRNKISNEIIRPAQAHGLDAKELCIVECYVIRKEY